MELVDIVKSRYPHYYQTVLIITGQMHEKYDFSCNDMDAMQLTIYIARINKERGEVVQP